MSQERMKTMQKERVSDWPADISEARLQGLLDTLVHWARSLSFAFDSHDVCLSLWSWGTWALSSSPVLPSGHNAAPPSCVCGGWDRDSAQVFTEVLAGSRW